MGARGVPWGTRGVPVGARGVPVGARGVPVGARGALDPLNSPGGPLGPTLERTILYDVLKFSFFGHNSSLFQSCAILVSTIKFIVFLSIY